MIAGMASCPDISTRRPSRSRQIRVTGPAETYFLSIILYAGFGVIERKTDLGSPKKNVPDPKLPYIIQLLKHFRISR
jgi:hypothetical protein